MSALAKRLLKPAAIAFCLFFVSLFYYGYAALNFPTLFNLDNVENFAATRYISEHRRIPRVTADDKELFFSEIGTTRSLRPPFTFIVSAIAANFAAGAVEDPNALQRLGSPIIAAATVTIIFLGFYIAFKHFGLALSGSIGIALMPKFVLLASSNNDDIGAILSVSLLFASVIALVKHGYKIWVLVALAFSLGLVLQTKYTAWLTLPWFGLFCIMQLRAHWLKVIKLMPLLLVVVIAAGGWWILFNMVNYGVTDPTALNYASQLQSILSDITPNQQGYASTGVRLIDLLSNHDGFLLTSFKSLIGYLQWLELEVGIGNYLFYAAIFVIALIGILCRSSASHRETAYFDILLLVLILSQCAFYLHHNLVRDIQPQARYILPVIMPMMYLFLRGIEQVPGSAFALSVNDKLFGFQAVLSTAFIIACFTLHANTVSNYLYPSFIQQPFYTSIRNSRKINMRTDLKIASTSSLAYKFIDDKLELSIAGSRSALNRAGQPGLVLGPEFCDQLPLNSIITMNVTSNLNGALSIRLDKNRLGTYEQIYWQGFQSGASTAVFSVNSDHCTGAKITLGKNTYKLTLDNFRISELRINRYARPI